MPSDSEINDPQSGHPPEAVADAPWLWGTPPMALRLPSDDVHLWRVPLDVSPNLIPELEKMLSIQEQKRAMGFHFWRDRRRYIIARAALRVALGKYLNKPPTDVVIDATPGGKPQLSADEKSAIQFNASHSRNLGLIAFTTGRTVGVDIEFADPGLPCHEVAPGFCTPRELEALRALAPDAMRTLFFKIWTIKEALLKARGQGFLTNPITLETCFRNGVLGIDTDDDLFLVPGDILEAEPFAAALVVSGSQRPRLTRLDGHFRHWTMEF